jgi:hypothetical protein
MNQEESKELKTFGQVTGLAVAIIFFITGLTMRLMGKDPMARKLDSSTESYRVNSRVRPKNHVERPF